MKQAYRRAIHRARRRKRNALFSDLGLRIGDRVTVVKGEDCWTSKIADLLWTFGGHRRFVILENGLHVRVGAEASICSPTTHPWKS